MPLKTGEDKEYKLALKQDLREIVMRMPTPEGMQDIERCMKVYKEEWLPDWKG
jgi:DNA-directed RNA polymerase III subunit RPC7